MTFPVSPDDEELHTEPDGVEYQYAALSNTWELIRHVDVMLKSIYDPTNISDNAFDRSKHTNVIQIQNVSGLAASLSALQMNINASMIGEILAAPIGNTLEIALNGKHYYHTLTKNLVLHVTYTSLSPDLDVAVVHFIQPAAGDGFTITLPENTKVGFWEFSTVNNAINEVTFMAPVSGQVSATCQVLI